MNKIDLHFQKKPKNNLAVYFTAGYPNLDTMPQIMQQLEQNGAGLIEIGIPYSDPLADGPIIQNSSSIALENGFSLQKMFDLLDSSSSKISIPKVFMGYLNPVMQFGFERFLENAARIGVSGLILPDLPPDIFENEYKSLYESYDIYPIFLITPQTPDDRIRYLDRLSKGFIYAVSSSATTGGNNVFSKTQVSYFERLSQLSLKNPVMIGFGVSKNDHLEQVWQHCEGAIIGSAFIKALDANDENLGITTFFNKLLNREIQ